VVTDLYGSNTTFPILTVTLIIRHFFVMVRQASPFLMNTLQKLAATTFPAVLLKCFFFFALSILKARYNVYKYCSLLLFIYILHNNAS